jgi:hypothetical protein
MGALGNSMAELPQNRAQRRVSQAASRSLSDAVIYQERQYFAGSGVSIMEGIPGLVKLS